MITRILKIGDYFTIVHTGLSFRVIEILEDGAIRAIDIDGNHNTFSKDYLNEAFLTDQYGIN